MLIAFGGRPGSGKTTVSRALALRLRAVWLRIDAIEGAMRRAGIPAEAAGIAAYAVAQDLAAANLANGLDAVADCVNPVAASRRGWAEAAARGGGAPLVEVLVVCSDAAEHRRRIEARATDVDGLPRVPWERALSVGFEPWPGATVTIDTARLSPEEAVAAILAAAPPPA